MQHFVTCSNIAVACWRVLYGHFFKRRLFERLNNTLKGSLAHVSKSSLLLLAGQIF